MTSTQSFFRLEKQPALGVTEELGYQGITYEGLTGFNDQGTRPTAMRILLTGASGQLGAYLIERLLERQHAVIAWSGTETGQRLGVSLTRVDLLDASSVFRALSDSNPDAIIHAAAVSAAEAVRLDPSRAHSVNFQATSRIAEWAEGHDRRLVYTSTDLVFDGSRAWNREQDPAEPILAYGQTKRLAEPAVMAIPKGVVARLGLLHGHSKCGRPYFFTRALESLRGGQPQTFFEDEFRTPLDLATAAHILVLLAESEVSGLFHVGGVERISRFELMTRAAKALGLDPALIRPGRRADANLSEPRPADVSLDTSKLASAFPEIRRPTIEQALRQDDR